MIRILVVAALGAGVSTFALAQSAQDVERAQQQSQQIFQQQQQLERQRLEQEQERSQIPSGQDLTAPAPTAPTQKATGTCTEVKTVRLDGATHLSVDVQARLTQPFAGKCLSLADINRLVGELVNDYVGRGYITTRVYIPQQDLSAGTLILEVVEGTIEGLRIVPGDSANLATAFPGLTGTTLNLRDLEQGIDQLNRLSSNAARIDIAPGDAPGESIVELSNQVHKRWTVSLGLDNSGTPSTGYNTWSAAASVDNLAGLNDYLNVSGRHSEAGPDSQRHSDGGSLYWNVPYGYWNASLALNEFHYESLIAGELGPLATDGTSAAQTWRIDRLVYRDQSTKWAVDVDLTTKQTRNAIDGQRLAVSSADLTLLDAGTNWTWSEPGTLVSLSGGFTAGVNALGSTTDDPGRPAGAPRSAYQRWSYGASVVKAVDLAGLPVSFDSTLSGQQSRDSLYSTEQLSIGSLYTVRGYRLDTLAGSSGWYARNDLALPLTLARVFGAGADEGQVRPYIGYDIGHINGIGTLGGWSVGIDCTYRWVTVQLAYSHPSVVPTSQPAESGWLFARLTLTY